MIQIPTWMLSIMFGLIAVLLTVIGYLIRFFVSSNQKKDVEQDGRITDLERKQFEVEKKFIELERDNTKQFVSHEAWTRDYITLTNRVDAAFRKLDRIEDKK